MADQTLIYVGGVPGSGKTTICKKIARDLKGLKYISSGEIKGGEAWKRFGSSLSTLNQRRSFEINGWFFDVVQQTFNSGTYLLDTHYTYPLQDRSFVRLLPEEYAQNIDSFVLLEASAEEITKRRIRRGRDRDSIDMSFIEKELDKEHTEAIRLAKKYSKPIEIINNMGTAPEGVQDLKEFLKRNFVF